jgi:K+/H+ antiporter YhaU regulatory subunit KhtT
MEFWKKVKTALSGGAETVSGKTIEWSHLAKLRWEHRNIQGVFQKNLNELGQKTYQLHAERREKQILDETREIIQKLNSLEEELNAKKQEIDEIVSKGVDRTELNQFKKDLELGDGKIVQVALNENSKIAGKKLMEIKIPQNALVGTIVRNAKVIIPDGKTVFQAGDKVTLIGEKDDVEKAIQILEKTKDSSA